MIRTHSNQVINQVILEIEDLRSIARARAGSKFRRAPLFRATVNPDEARLHATLLRVPKLIGQRVSKRPVRGVNSVRL